MLQFYFIHAPRTEWVEWLFKNQNEMNNFSAISWQEQVRFQRDDDDEVRFVLDQRAYLDFYSSSSPKQQCIVTTWTHYPDSWPISREAKNSNFIVFGLTRLGLQHLQHRCGSSYNKVNCKNEFKSVMVVNVILQITTTTQTIAV